MNNDFKTKLLMFIGGLIRRFYLGIPAILFLLLGLFSTNCRCIGFFFLGLWLVITLIDQISIAIVFRKNPELQETVNSFIANDKTMRQAYQDGQEIVFTDLKEQEVQLVGRCLNSENNIWTVRLIYEGSYQIFDWKVKNGEYYKTELVSISNLEGHGKEFLVKTYEEDSDGRVRAQLYWLKRTGAIYKDYRLNLLRSIEEVNEMYDMKWENATETLYLFEKNSEKDIPQSVAISLPNMGGAPLEMIYGNTIFYDFKHLVVKLSIGEKYESLGIGENANHFIVGRLAFLEEEIRGEDWHIEVKEEK